MLKPVLFESKIVQFDEGHKLSAHWWKVITGLLSSTKLGANMYLQADGSIIYRIHEQHGSKGVYYIRVYPDGKIEGHQRHE